MAIASPTLGRNPSRRDLEQYFPLSGWFMVQAHCLRFHFPRENFAFAFCTSRVDVPYFLRNIHLPYHGLDAIIRQRLFPQMGQRLRCYELGRSSILLNFNTTLPLVHERSNFALPDSTPRLVPRLSPRPLRLQRVPHLKC